MLLSAVNEGGWNERAGGRRVSYIFCSLSAVSLWGQTLNLKSFLGLGCFVILLVFFILEISFVNVLLLLTKSLGVFE